MAANKTSGTNTEGGPIYGGPDNNITLGKVGTERRVDIDLPPQPMRGVLDDTTITALEGGATCSRHE